MTTKKRVKKKHYTRKKRINKVFRGGSNKTRAFKKANCAPSNEHKDYTCYTPEALNKMKQLWNARHPDHKIVSTTPRDIWTALKTNMLDTCDVETCWLDQEFVKNDLKKELSNSTFTPASPKSWTKNPTEWLSSVDITKVMKQYEKADKHFVFIGPSPIDFDTREMYNQCVWEELCNFNLKKHVEKGKTKIGIIFNTDPHYLKGSHWISLFINVKKRFIFFFDSNGDPVPKEIDVLCKRIMDQAKAMGITLIFRQNAPLEHQYENTECGMYSLYFIISLIKETHNHTYFMKHRIPDKLMKALRLKFFNVGGNY